MSEGLNKLKTIGAQKIHEKTHISTKHVQAILHESFEDINKLQFMGFVSILEREYNLKLDDLKSKGFKYFAELTPEPTENETVFVAPKKKKSYTKLYLFIVVLIFIAVALFSINSASLLDNQTQNIEIEDKKDSVIESAKKIMVVENNQSKKDDNISNDINKTVTPLVVKESKKKVLEPKKVEAKPEKEVKAEVKTKKAESLKTVKSSLVIKPKTKVWMGYIDLKTHKKHQTVFKNSFKFDTKKDWIIVFGHGYLNIDVDGKIKKYNTKSNLRFSYKNGKFKKIDLKEFRALNRGKTW